MNIEVEVEEEEEVDACLRSNGKYGNGDHCTRVRGELERKIMWDFCSKLHHLARGSFLYKL